MAKKPKKPIIIVQIERKQAYLLKKKGIYERGLARLKPLTPEEETKLAEYGKILREFAINIHPRSPKG